MDSQLIAKPGEDNVSAQNDGNRLLLLNRISLFCHTALTILLIFVTVGVALVLLDLVTIVFAPFWLWIVFALSIPELIAAVISNKLLRKNTGALLDMDVPRPSGDYIVRKKFSWMYSPDKLEKWLEQMESQGYRLHGIGKRGRSFYFTKDQGKKMQYWVDFQLMADYKYYLTHSQSGWKPLFATYGSFGKWNIWVKESSPGQDPQPINSMANHALITAIAYSGVLMSMLLLIGSGIIVSAETAFIYGAHNIVMVLLLSGLILFSLIQTTARAWLYFRRQKNLAN